MQEDAAAAARAARARPGPRARAGQGAATTATELRRADRRRPRRARRARRRVASRGCCAAATPSSPPGCSCSPRPTAAAIVALDQRRRGPGHAPAGNGIAAIGAAGRAHRLLHRGRDRSEQHRRRRRRSLGPQHRGSTPSRASTPRPKAVIDVQDARPADRLAAGGGALWIGNGGGEAANATVSISRVDPGHAEITRTVKLPDSVGQAAGRASGFPRDRGRRGRGLGGERQRPCSASTPRPAGSSRPSTQREPTIAAGAEGVWIVEARQRREAHRSAHEPGRRDDPSRQPRTVGDRRRRRLGVGDVRGGLAVADQTRAAPDHADDRRRARRLVRRLRRRRGLDRQLRRRQGLPHRPAHEQVTARIPVGAPQALAAGGGSAWVSVAGRTRAGALPASSCGEVASGGRKPDVLIASDLPLQGPFGADQRAMADAIRFVLDDHDFRAGNTSSATDLATTRPRRPASSSSAGAPRTRTRTRTQSDLVAVIGPYNSFCAQVEIPILNRATGGPLAMISPSTTLTRA